MIHMQIRRKNGNYKLYKLPEGAVMLPFMNATHIADQIRLQSNGTYIDEMYKLRKDECIVVNCDYNIAYRLTCSEFNKIFEFEDGKSLSEHVRHVDKAFNKLFYYDKSNDCIINGARLRLKNTMLGLVDAIIVLNKFGKKQALIDGTKYDMDRFTAEFDNRSIPAKLRAVRYETKPSYEDYLKSLFDVWLDTNIEANIYNRINESIISKYDDSILAYYDIPRPEVIGDKLIYHSLVDMEFTIKTFKFNEIALYKGNVLNRQVIIGKTSYSNFERQLEHMFALHNKEMAYKIIPRNISLCGAKLINEYKADSGLFNNEIKNAFSNSPISSLEYYIKAMYLHKLLHTCKSDRVYNLYRGGLNRDDTLTFKSASFALPVALSHGKTDEDAAVIMCNAGTNMVLSNYTGEFSHEAEVILDAGWKITGNGKSRTLEKTSDSVEIKNSAVIEIANAILFSKVLQNYLYIGSINRNKIEVYWLNDTKMGVSNITVNTNEEDAVFRSGDTTYRFALNRLNEFIQRLEYSVKDMIRQGMHYRSDCEMHRLLAMRTQVILINMGFNIGVQRLNNRSRIVCGSDYIEIDESAMIDITDNKGLHVRNIIRKEMIDIDDTVNRLCYHILNNFKLNYAGYVCNLLNLVKCSKIEYKDKIVVGAFSIYNSTKGIEIRNAKGKMVDSIKFTFNEVDDCIKICNALQKLGVHINGVDRSRQS